MKKWLFVLPTFVLGIAGLCGFFTTGYLREELFADGTAGLFLYTLFVLVYHVLAYLLEGHARERMPKATKLFFGYLTAVLGTALFCAVVFMGYRL